MADIHVHIHLDAHGTPSRLQATDEDAGMETDQDVERRLMRVYSDGGTLTPEEFDFLKRRGCVRY